MPLTQKAPREPGCSGLGAIFVTLPPSTVSNEPHSAEHSQHVLGTVVVPVIFGGRTFIAIASCAAMRYPRAGSAGGARIPLHRKMLIAGAVTRVDQSRRPRDVLDLVARDPDIQQLPVAQILQGRSRFVAFAPSADRLPDRRDN